MDSYYDTLGTAGAVIYSIFCLAIAAWCIICTWRVFNKACENGWAAIVPFYNTFTLFKITWGNGWKFLFLLIPVANVVFYIITMVKLARAFGKSSGFAVGLIFLYPIFMGILAFDQSTYQGVPA